MKEIVAELHLAKQIKLAESFNQQKTNFLNYNQLDLKDQFQSHLQKAGKLYESNLHTQITPYTVKIFDQRQPQSSLSQANHDFKQEDHQYVHDSEKPFVNEIDPQTDKQIKSRDNKSKPTDAITQEKDHFDTKDKKIDEVKDKIDQISSKSDKKETTQEITQSKITKKLGNQGNKKSKKAEVKKAESVEKQKLKQSHLQSKENIEWQNIVNLLEQFVDKSEGNISGELKEKLDTLLTQLKGLGGKANKHSKNNTLKELKSLFNQLQNFIDENDPQKGKSYVLTSKDQKNVMKEIIADIQNLFEKTNKEIDKIKPLFDLEKLTIQSVKSAEIGIQNKTKNRAKLNAVKENGHKDSVETQSIIQKTEVKPTESGGDAKMDFGYSPGKTTILDRGIALPKGSNIQNPSALFNQIVNKAAMTLKPGQTEMEIKLDPKIMGNLNIKVIVSKDGFVSGQFLVENQMVKNFLDANIHLLKENLESQGLTFDELNIFLADEHKGSFAQYEQENNSHNRGYSTENFDNLTMTEESLTGRYILPDWLAKEVDLVI